MTGVQHWVSRFFQSAPADTSGRRPGIPGRAAHWFRRNASVPFRYRDSRAIQANLIDQPGGDPAEKNPPRRFCAAIESTLDRQEDTTPFRLRKSDRPSFSWPAFALLHPERTQPTVQNGKAYAERLRELWGPINNHSHLPNYPDSRLSRLRSKRILGLRLSRARLSQAKGRKYNRRGSITRFCKPIAHDKGFSAAF
jgi:hypothetical protein